MKWTSSCEFSGVQTLLTVAPVQIESGIGAYSLFHMTLHFPGG